MNSLIRRIAIHLFLVYLTYASTFQKVQYGRTRAVKGLSNDRELFIGLKHLCKDTEHLYLKSKDAKNSLFVIKFFSGDNDGVGELHLETLLSQKGEGRGINVQIHSATKEVAHEDFDICGLAGFKCYQAVDENHSKGSLRCSFKYGRSKGVLPYIELQDDSFMKSIQKYSIYVPIVEDESASESDDLTFAVEWKREPVIDNMIEFSYDSPQKESTFMIENSVDPTVRLYGAGGAVLGEIYFSSISLNYGFMAYIKRFDMTCSITDVSVTLDSVKSLKLTQEKGLIILEVNGEKLNGSSFCANWDKEIKEYGLLKGAKPAWLQ